jgi:hypothetical protein
LIPYHNKNRCSLREHFNGRFKQKSPRFR